MTIVLAFKHSTFNFLLFSILSSESTLTFSQQELYLTFVLWATSIMGE